MADTTPTSIDHSAPVVAHHSRLIRAPLEIVWAVHTRIQAWPEWQTDMRDLVADSPVLDAGSSFTWSTQGLAIRSTVYRVDNEAHETLWGGPANGIAGLHAWFFEPRGTRDTLVTTEESWRGDPVTADVTAAQQALDASLTRWLELLSARALSRH